MPSHPSSVQAGCMSSKLCRMLMLSKCHLYNNRLSKKHGRYAMRIKATFDNACQAENIFPAKAVKRLSSGLHPHTGIRRPTGWSDTPEGALPSVMLVNYIGQYVCLRLINEFPDIQHVLFAINIRWGLQSLTRDRGDKKPASRFTRKPRELNHLQNRAVPSMQKRYLRFRLRHTLPCGKSMCSKAANLRLKRREMRWDAAER
jgi:hypothetical protein